jgi:GT2 family glycosyltransferase/MoaA/NifB/PqqE/SkfB family radical SAM enzyme
MSCGRAWMPPPASTPRTLWIELTSKCAFDCIFCSRKLRRGIGQHLPFPVYKSLVRSLVDPRRLVLNYSGESTYYPELIPAIRLARSTGAYVELVSVVASMRNDMLRPLARSGLNRLTVSMHTTDPRLFAEIYRHGSFEEFQSKLEMLVSLCREAPQSPTIDIGFVAMERNLGEMPAVAAFAHSLGAQEVLVFPVMRRDDIENRFLVELNEKGALLPVFRAELAGAVKRTQEANPGIRVVVCNPLLTDDPPRLGEVPMPFPWSLPDGAEIYTCEQNPFETMHVLSNGEVVACEVLDRVPLGNLMRQSIDEVWDGEPYQRLRERYVRGEIVQCRECVWKHAVSPTELKPEILASRGASSQLLRGWHEAEEGAHVWSTQRALAVLSPRPGSSSIHLSGVLPPGRDSEPNQLVVTCAAEEIGGITNPWGEAMPFGIDLPIRGSRGDTLLIEFRTSHVYRPSERGSGSDHRDLGFALVLLASSPQRNAKLSERQRRQLLPLEWLTKLVDQMGRAIGSGHTRPAQAIAHPRAVGMTIIIPERDNVEDLSACLESVRRAADRLNEPVQIVVVANATPARRYAALMGLDTRIEWQFHHAPLGFARAVSLGLRAARHDWIYLLNNDVVLETDALQALAPYRKPQTFSIASQIFLQDKTRFREETNWCALTEERGLAEIADAIPVSNQVVQGFYAGGGASLFQRRLLRALIDPAAYPSFYWEDVEWGWRARKLGYSSLFCPESVAHHRQGATVTRFFTPSDVEQMRRSNRAMFQLRNWTGVGSLKSVLEDIANAPEATAATFLDRRTHWHIIRGRLWNHRAPITDEVVMSSWKRPISNS